MESMAGDLDEIGVNKSSISVEHAKWHAEALNRSVCERTYLDMQVRSLQKRVAEEESKRVAAEASRKSAQRKQIEAQREVCDLQMELIREIKKSSDLQRSCQEKDNRVQELEEQFGKLVQKHQTWAEHQGVVPDSKSKMLLEHQHTPQLMGEWAHRPKPLRLIFPPSTMSPVRAILPSSPRSNTSSLCMSASRPMVGSSPFSSPSVPSGSLIGLEVQSPTTLSEF